MVSFSTSNVLGDVLIQALKETALEDPADPIDFLAHWLLHHRDVEDQWNEFREDQKKLAQEKAEFMAQREAEMKRLEEERLAREAEEKRLAEEKLKLEAELSKQKKGEEEEDAAESKEETETTTTETNEQSGYSESLGDTY